MMGRGNYDAMRENHAYNLPPGVSPEDIDRIFGDQEPPEGATCGGCRWARPCRFIDGCDGLVCICEEGDLLEVERAQEACDGWEEAWASA